MIRIPFLPTRQQSGSHRLSGIAHDEKGAALIEMAFVLPILMMLIMGMVIYSSWFFTAHSIQLAASDGARAAIAGITASERATLANATANTTLTRISGLSAQRANVAIDDDGRSLVVRITYDASDNPLFSLPFVPSAGKSIKRSAAIHLESE